MSRMQQRWRQIEPYWYVILLFALAGTIVYLNHLRTGFTPSRVALRIEAFNLDVFWYGVLIVSGIALGAYVTSRLATEKSRRIFNETVPRRVQRRPVAKMNLPEEIQKALTKLKITTLGDLLLQWGWNPGNLGLNDAGKELLGKKLVATDGVAADWLEDAPWRPWSPDHVWSGIVWCLVLAVIGARLYHVLTPSPSMAAVGINSPADYFRQPFQLINLRNGGLGLYGGIAGGLLGLYIFARRNNLSAIGWADLAAVGLPLGQFIGRWGNFLNQELYGRPTDLPWAVTIDPAHRLPDYADVSRFHPAFLYESIWNLFAFFVLLRLARRYHDRLQTGDLMALYLIFYAIGRSLLETVRLDSRTVTLGSVDFGLPIATLVSLVIGVAMAIWIYARHRRNSA